MNELLQCWDNILERSSPHGNFMDVEVLELIDNNFSNPLLYNENTWANFRDKYIVD